MNEISTPTSTSTTSPTSTSPTSTTRDPITATMYRAALRTMPTGDVYTGDNLTLTYGDAFADHIEETARIMGDLASLTGRDTTPTYPLSGCERCTACASLALVRGEDDGPGSPLTDPDLHTINVCLVCHHVGVWDYAAED